MVRLLRQQDSLDVGQDTTLGNRDVLEKTAQLLEIVSFETREVIDEPHRCGRLVGCDEG